MREPADRQHNRNHSKNRTGLQTGGAGWL